MATGVGCHHGRLFRHKTVFGHGELRAPRVPKASPRRAILGTQAWPLEGCLVPDRSVRQEAVAFCQRFGCKGKTQEK